MYITKTVIFRKQIELMVIIGQPPAGLNHSPTEPAAPSSQQPHLLSESYLSYVHVHFEIPGHTQ